MATTGFEAEAARKAFSEASQEIGQVIKKFQTTADNLIASVSGSGSALGGQLGSFIANKFSEGSAMDFQSLQQSSDKFINERVSQLLSTFESANTDTQSYYGES